MAPNKSNKKLLKLTTRENETLRVEEKSARISKTLNNIIEDVNHDANIPVPNVDKKTMKKIIDWMNMHADENQDADKLKKFDNEYVKVDHKFLFNLIMAANYLEIKDLLDLLCGKAADMIKDKKPEEIREMFNIKNDFTREEEEKIRADNAWAFE